MLLSDQTVIFFIKIIIIVFQCHDVNESLNGILQLHIEAPSGHAGNDAVVLFADMLQHIFGFLQLHSLSFCLCSTLLHRTRLLRHMLQNGRIFADSAALVETSPQIILDNAVDLQIRVTADW